MSVSDTIRAIKLQDGLVVIPHPLDKYRSGLDLADMDAVITQIDAVETLNGRTIGKPNLELAHWAKAHGIATVASSDAHTKSGLGRTYTQIDMAPSGAAELLESLSEHGRLVYELSLIHI